MDLPDGRRSFSIIWLAQLVAKVANGLTPFALSIYVYQQTGLSTSIALTTLAGFLPTVLLAPLAGILADRFNRKSLMMLSNALFALSLGVTIMMVTHDPICALRADRVVYLRDGQVDDSLTQGPWNEHHADERHQRLVTWLREKGF